MNGFEIMLNAYQKAAAEGKISEEQAKKIGKVYGFLTTCDPDDFFILFDSTAFNEISLDYLRKAVKNLVNKGIIEEEQAAAVRNEYSFLLSEKTAKEITA